METYTLSSTHLLNSLEVNLDDLLVNVVVPSGGDVRNISARPWREHDPVLHKRVLKHNPIDVSSCDPVPNLIARRIIVRRAST